MLQCVTPEVFGRVRENMQNNRVQQHLAEMAIPVALETTDGGVEKKKEALVTITCITKEHQCQ